MSRLIDADELIKAIENHKTNVASESGFANEIYSLAHEHIIDVINIQPTAFDTEKVVEQLEEMKNNKDCQVYCYEFYKKKCMIHENAIDIVKKGGVE